jgi:hypothetical protein
MRGCSEATVHKETAATLEAAAISIAGLWALQKGVDALGVVERVTQPCHDAKVFRGRQILAASVQSGSRATKRFISRVAARMA